MREEGRSIGVALVEALTWPKARKLSTQLVYDLPKQVLSAHKLLVKARVDGSGDKPDKANPSLSEGTVFITEKEGGQEEVTSNGEVLLPLPSINFQKLVAVTRESLISEQKCDSSLTRIWETYRKDVAKANVSLPIPDGLLYQHYRDRCGRSYDQLEVPERYRADVLQLCHEAGCVGHLNNKKTKERLLYEFYWPGCFRNAKNPMRACNACQRVGKSNQKFKAPLKLVPLISEPFNAW